MEILKKIEQDPDGLETYEYIVNHVYDCREEMQFLIDNMKRVDSTGQFLASTARFLTAVDREAFADVIPEFIEAAIAKDRERKYIGSLLDAIWGPDYMEKAEELKTTDNNFRRIFKRIYSEESVVKI